jgi:rubrerythrin
MSNMTDEDIVWFRDNLLRLIEGEDIECQSLYDIAEKLIASHNQGRKTINHMQHKIDSLMFEYCPDEMSENQLAEWGRHQVTKPDGLHVCDKHKKWPCRECGTKHYPECKCAFCMPAPPEGE